MIESHEFVSSALRNGGELALEWNTAEVPEVDGTETIASSHRADPGDARLPNIEVTDRMRVQTECSLNALNAANKIRPRFYKRGGAIVRVRTDEGQFKVEPLTTDSLRGELERVANFIRSDPSGDYILHVAVPPPLHVVRDILTLPDLTLPNLSSVAFTPFFTSSGELVDEPGYHEASGVYLKLDPDLTVPKVPRVPTSQDLDRAISLLCDDLLGDFPFADKPSKAHAVGAMVTPFMRHMIEGPIPLHAVDAPDPGSGKGLLVATVSLVSTGSAPGIIPETKSTEELRKQITSLLIVGPAIALIDNVQRTVGGGPLAALLTAHIWKDRLLSKSTMLELPNRTLWFVTANNLQVTAELFRRTVRIRLDARTEDPSTRENFRHSDLPVWTRLNRGNLIWACLILVQNWIILGRPAFSRAALGSFYSWSTTLGGILQSAGVEGFLENREALRSEINPDRDEWKRFVKAWWSDFNVKPVQTYQLLKLMQEQGYLLEIMDEDFNTKSQLSKLGKALRSRKDSTICGYLITETQIVDEQSRERNAWRLTPMDVGTLGNHQN